MSAWDAYIDTLIGYAKDASGHAHIDKACLVGLDKSCWTSATHQNSLKVSADEISKVVSNFSSSSGGSFPAEGIVVEGVKYQFLRFDDEAKVALGKKKGSGAVTAQAIKTCVVIAHCPEGGQAGMSNTAVSKVCEYLAGQGY